MHLLRLARLTLALALAGTGNVPAHGQDRPPAASAAEVAAVREPPLELRRDMDGPLFSLGGFRRLAVGVGWNLGEHRVVGPHFAATAYGVALEFSAPDVLLGRAYGRLYGGSAGLLLGLSASVSTRSSEVFAGVGPEIGFGFGPVNLLYRYELHLDPELRGHQFVLVLYAGLLGG
ncbi:MAG TPA: hypothetical protein VLS93_09270 [Anaeromyxobacteraceae bacterium]|nr:hypothetical protein [Anaeromyxobacteraceae bacterium]